MRTLLVHPGGLMRSEIFLPLEPQGAERVAAGVRASNLYIYARRHLAPTASRDG